MLKKKSQSELDPIYILVILIMSLIISCCIGFCYVIDLHERLEKRIIKVEQMQEYIGQEEEFSEEVRLEKITNPSNNTY